VQCKTTGQRLYRHCSHIYVHPSTAQALSSSITLRGMSWQPLPALHSSMVLSCPQVTCSAVYMYAAAPSLAAGCSGPSLQPATFLGQNTTSSGALAGHMAKHRQHTYPIPAATRRSAAPDPPKQQQQQAGSTRKHTNWPTDKPFCNTQPKWRTCHGRRRHLPATLMLI
jgi:hypothetical protein